MGTMLRTDHQRRMHRRKHMLVWEHVALLIRNIHIYIYAI